MLVTIYSTFGNDLEPTSHWLEVIFSIVIVLSGLMLFTLLIGNIQVCTMY
jgi:cyclic nucleotide gated channel